MRIHKLLAKLTEKEKRHNLRYFSDDYRKADMWGQGEETSPIGDYTVTVDDVVFYLRRMPCQWSVGSGGSGVWNQELFGFNVLCDKVLFAEFNVEKQSLNWLQHSAEAEQYLSEISNKLLERIVKHEAFEAKSRAQKEAKGAQQFAARAASAKAHEATVLNRFGVTA